VREKKIGKKLFLLMERMKTQLVQMKLIQRLWQIMRNLKQRAKNQNYEEKKFEIYNM